MKGKRSLSVFLLLELRRVHILSGANKPFYIVGVDETICQAQYLYNSTIRSRLHRRVIREVYWGRHPHANARRNFTKSITCMNVELYKPSIYSDTMDQEILLDVTTYVHPPHTYPTIHATSEFIVYRPHWCSFSSCLYCQKRAESRMFHHCPLAYSYSKSARVSSVCESWLPF
jgi:hypothetical protein